MLIKSKNKKVGIGLIVATTCIVVAILWAVLATPETALAAPPDRPGGNVVKQDIPAILTLDGGSLTSDDGSYSNLENGISCWVGRRRSIWVTLSKNSPRSMNLELGNVDKVDGDPVIGADPWGVPVMTPAEVQDLGLPSVSISQVDLHIAPYLNVSGLGTGHELAASTWLLFLDGEGDQWGLYFGRGRTTEDGWGGARFFTELSADPVIVSCLTENKSWTVTSITPGYLWYRGSKKNAPWVYVGKCDVPWSCNVEYIP